jgi:hypothetical protein
MIYTITLSIGEYVWTEDIEADSEEEALREAAEKFSQYLAWPDDTPWDVAGKNATQHGHTAATEGN